MSYRNLEDALASVKNPVDLLRNSQIGPYAFPVVRHEFTNWRDEQRSWRETCALFDQSHHMTDLYVEGPDALKVLLRPRREQLQELQGQPGEAVRRLQPPGLRHRRRDPVLPRRRTGSTSSAGRRRRTGCSSTSRPAGYNAKIERDERSAQNQGRRKTFRFQVQGPNALKVMEKVLGEPPCPTSGSSTWASSRSPGCDVRALRHGMVGQPGWELFGTVGTRRRGARRASSKPARSSASARSARGRIRRAVSNRDGFRRRCRRSTPATR